MKVAFFLGSLNHGGAEVIVHDICLRHSQLPFEVICLYRNEGNLSEAMHRFEASSVCIPKRMSWLLYLLNLRRIILSQHIDIVHSQTPFNTILCSFALMGTGVHVFTTFHGHSFADASKWQRSIVYAKSKVVVCVSAFEKQFYEHRWNLPAENKLVVVHNGVDFSRIYMRDIKNNHLGLSSVRLCMVGNFQNGRSPLIVCKALNLLQRKDVDFSFIGKRVSEVGWRYDECVSYCQEHNLSNVHFLGARNDVPDLLASMDGFVYSTEHDTFGVAVVEAMAAGLPVIVNDWAVMKEITHNGQWATLFKTSDVEDCANKIQDLIEHLPERKVQAQRIAKEVREEYSIEKHIERLYSIYKGVVKK